MSFKYGPRPKSEGLRRRCTNRKSAVWGGPHVSASHFGGLFRLSTPQTSGVRDWSHMLPLVEPQATETHFFPQILQFWSLATEQRHAPELAILHWFLSTNLTMCAGNLRRTQYTKKHRRRPRPPPLLRPLGIVPPPPHPCDFLSLLLRIPSMSLRCRVCSG